MALGAILGVIIWPARELWRTWQSRKIQATNREIALERLEHDREHHDKYLALQTQREQAHRELELLKHQQQLAFQRERFEKERELQLQLVAYNRDTQLLLAAIRREELLLAPEAKKIFDNWPLTITPSEILTAHRNTDRLPLRVFISPPSLQYDRTTGRDAISDMETGIAEGIRSFLQRHYPRQNSERPTEFVGGS
jgi:hypothetical protein